MREVLPHCQLFFFFLFGPRLPAKFRFLERDQFVRPDPLLRAFSSFPFSVSASPFPMARQRPFFPPRQVETDEHQFARISFFFFLACASDFFPFFFPPEIVPRALPRDVAEDFLRRLPFLFFRIAGGVLDFSAGDGPRLFFFLLMTLHSANGTGIARSPLFFFFSLSPGEQGPSFSRRLFSAPPRQDLFR